MSGLAGLNFRYLATSCIECAGSKTDKLELPPTTPFTFAASDGRNGSKAQKSRKNKVHLLCGQGLRVWMCKIVACCEVQH